MNISAILFDLNDTLTTTKDSVLNTIRKICYSNGVDLNCYSDEQLEQAFQRSNAVMMEYVGANNVLPSWGESEESWLPFDRIMFEELDINDLTDATILSIERDFKHITRDTDWEFFTEDALYALRTLNAMGFKMGICTRRSDNPIGLLERNNLDHIFGSIQWSGVPGYAKPSPYTLLQAARELEINPHHCFFVGNYVNADVEAAIRCEMQPVLLTWANPDEAEKAPDSCIVLDKPFDLVKWIQNQGESSRASGI
ncbi:MAG: HAD family hydrolase [Candidatus Thorarchaeota archaeon]